MSEPNLNLGYTIFCEDVRVEASQHLSLMGVFHQIVVPQVPITMIKFGVVTHWTGEGQYLSEVRILTADKMNTVAISQPSSFTIPAGGYSDNVTVFVNTNFLQAGDYIVQILINSSLFAEKILPVLTPEQPNPFAEIEHIN
jgi:hypothetical protein